MSGTPAATRLQSSLLELQARIAAAAAESGREAGAVRLIAVTKGLPPESIQQILRLGLVDHGENRPERLPELALHFPPAERPRWHLIGHVQSRKLRAALPLAACIQSIHSLELLELVEARLQALGREIPCLVQVNVSGEATKQGVDAAHLRPLIERAASCRHARVTGLMTMAPIDAPVAVQARVFAAARALRDGFATKDLPLKELSMGMSGDFEAAIREGATMVRIGTALTHGAWEA